MAKAFSMKGSESKKLRLRVAQVAQRCSYYLYLNRKNMEWHHPPAPLHPHSDSPLYLTHSTTDQSGGRSRRQCPGTPHTWQTRSNDLVVTTILAGGCSISVSMFCILYGLLALWGLCAHLYEQPPTNPTLSSIWAPTVGRSPAPPQP